jgi:hypothetical protein
MKPKKLAKMLPICCIIFDAGMLVCAGSNTVVSVLTGFSTSMEDSVSGKLIF